MQTDYAHNTLAQALAQPLKPRVYEPHTLNFRPAITADSLTSSSND